MCTKSNWLKNFYQQTTQSEVVDQADSRIARSADFVDKIGFSDETYFHLHAFVPKLLHEHLQVIHENANHTKCVTFWCALWPG